MKKVFLITVYDKHNVEIMKQKLPVPEPEPGHNTMTTAKGSLTTKYSRVMSAVLIGAINGGYATIQTTFE